MAKSKYMEDFPLLAEGYAREGLNDEQIAKKLGLSIQTFYTYQNKYVEFLEAIKKGKAPIDINVENALYKRTQGYTVIEEKTEDSAMGIKVTKTIKHIAPDVGACIFWLKNRKPKRWKDKQIVSTETDKDAGLKNLLEEGE